MGEETMVRFYGLGTCPDCRVLKATLTKMGRSFEFLDLASVRNLRNFLLLRDSDSAFDEPRSQKRVGIPCLLHDDGTVGLDWRTELGITKNDEVSEAEAEAMQAAQTTSTTPTVPAGSACSINGDHSGC